MYCLLLCRDTVVYEDDCIKTVQLEFASLALFKSVSPTIVDTWSAYLNNMEKLKAPETVSRVFFSTKPCVSEIPYVLGCYLVLQLQIIN